MNVSEAEEVVVEIILKAFAPSEGARIATMSARDWYRLTTLIEFMGGPRLAGCELWGWDGQGGFVDADCASDLSVQLTTFVDSPRWQAYCVHLLEQPKPEAPLTKADTWKFITFCQESGGFRIARSIPNRR